MSPGIRYMKIHCTREHCFDLFNLARNNVAMHLTDYNIEDNSVIDHVYNHNISLSLIYIMYYRKCYG